MTRTDELARAAAPARPRWVAPVGVLAIVAAVVIVRAVTSGASVDLPSALQDLITLAASVIIESLPFVVLGAVLAAVVRIWLPSGLLVRVLPRNPVLRRLAICVIGVLLPVCECGNVPLARGLLVSGLSVSESMTFLLAAPIVNPITILTTYQAFGFSDGVLIARVAGGLGIALLVGAVFAARRDGMALLTERFAAECRMPHAHVHGSRWTASGREVVAELGTLMPALFVGAVVAAGIQVVVPRSVLVTLGENPLWSVLALMALAFVISVCSNVDAFFILPFASAFLPGGVVAFLVFGPLVDVKMLALMRTTFRASTLVPLAVVVALAALALGLAVNLGV
ncbi:permease [Galbitalea sp. SE-J8]|uniref:permease n=1 Tax=Galbitalea sp. SE-J8 TaxID=3054952 RepID=UPI00259CFC41|nr:permease [Galbitalea sp. SE-J8]MDM4761693.1 permease [Galbitalea sp. SE-J8]